jgi:uncharacterized membrane protein YphA (DoxX/SURF4 family)
MQYLQAFVGILFIFSGWVKAIDPLGTAYKIKDYFDEFANAFEPTFFSFLSPIFHYLNNYIVTFSVGMIVFEIVLGFMILFGIYRKFATWAFFILLIVFTFMTGFTYLTGYVPSDNTFFDFASWGPYLKSNMKVTDCGCFGDFIKLEPKVSFIKDILLLIPGFIFLVFRKKMNVLLEGKKVFWLTLLATSATLLYCFSNFVWDIPHIDFRPFKEGVNINKQKLIEEEAQASVQVTGFLMENKKDPSKKMEVSMKDYANFTEEWKVLDQIKTESKIPSTKISSFNLSDADGNEADYQILENTGKAVIIVAYKLYGNSTTSTVESVDTINIEDPSSGEVVTKLVSSEKKIVDFVADQFYTSYYAEKIVPYVNEAKKNGQDIFFLAGGVSAEELADFAADINMDATLLTADDILLKTIIRSNPGVMLMDKGVIVKKIHIRKLSKFID